MVRVEPQVVDYGLASAGIAYFLQVLPAVSGVLAAMLIVLRIIVAVQEYKLNRRKLQVGAVTAAPVAGDEPDHEPGAPKIP